MLTDWLVIRRLAAELDAALGGARIRGGGLLPGERFGLQTERGLLAFDPFGATPLVTLEEDRPLRAAPGWPRTLAESLVGLRVDRIRARRGDRLIAVDAASRSRFGVVSSYRLVAELVPRYGNLVLLKDKTVVAAAKSFAAGGRTVRTVSAGEEYEPPPARRVRKAGIDLEQATTAFMREPASVEGRGAVEGALRSGEPLLPALAAESLVAEAAGLRWASSSALATFLIERARALIGTADEEADLVSEAYAYYNGDGSLHALGVTRLWQMFENPAFREERTATLLQPLSSLSSVAAEEAVSGAFESRRAALAARLEKRRAALARERATLERERDDSMRADALRRAGDIIYSNLTAIPAGASRFVAPDEPGLEVELDPSLSAKANASAYFKRYKKAATKGRHVERRLHSLGDAEGAVAQLAWELERAEPEDMEEFAAAVARLEGRKVALPRGAARRGPIEVRLGSDARALVGRSPRGNADLTFRIARPEELWFHTRGVPGAHVILRIDGTRAPRNEELRTAAELAAFHSRGREASKVEVDYTERKFVRKRTGGSPGLVWYTNARTLLVTPKDAANR